MLENQTIFQIQSKSMQNLIHKRLSVWILSERLCFTSITVTGIRQNHDKNDRHTRLKSQKNQLGLGWVANPTCSRGFPETETQCQLLKNWKNVIVTFYRCRSRINDPGLHWKDSFKMQWFLSNNTFPRKFCSNLLYSYLIATKVLVELLEKRIIDVSSTTWKLFVVVFNWTSNVLSTFWISNPERVPCSVQIQKSWKGRHVNSMHIIVRIWCVKQENRMPEIWYFFLGRSCKTGGVKLHCESVSSLW